MFEGHPAITGLVLSCTVTLNEQVDVFPAASVAVYVTTVVPRAKTDTGLFVLVKVNAPAQLSDTVGAVQLTVAWQEAFAFTVMFEGHPVITGLVLSTNNYIEGTSRCVSGCIGRGISHWRST